MEGVGRTGMVDWEWCWVSSRGGFVLLFKEMSARMLLKGRFHFANIDSVLRELEMQRYSLA